MSGGEVMFHYTLSTCHTEKTPRSDVRLETLAALRSTVEVAIGGKAVPLPGFPYYALSIRNTWTGAVGWLIEGAERRVLVRCVTAWDGRGRDEGLGLVGGDTTGGSGSRVSLLSGQAWSSIP